MFNPLKNLGELNDLRKQAMQLQNALKQIIINEEKGRAQVELSADMKIHSVKINGEEYSDLRDCQMLGYFPSSPPSPPISCIFCAAFFWAFSIASFRQSRSSLYSSPFILTEWIFISAESSTCALPFSSLIIICFSAF